MDIKKLQNLLKKPEGPKLDFKQSIDLETESGRKELAKDICAIANSKGGRGYLIIGVEDKSKNIIGIKQLLIVEEQIQQIISSRVDPPIPVALEFIDIEDKTLAVIEVYDGPQKPYQLRDNGAFYIRRGSTNDTMRKQEIVSALEENLNFNIELCPITSSGLRFIDKDIVQKYFKYQGITIDEENNIAMLESTSIIYMDRDSGKPLVTMGGLLVFSKQNNLLLPHNMIKITNNVKKDYNSDVIIQGDLISMLDKTEAVIQDILPKSYPREAVIEGVKNALLYRDYTMYNRIIEIVIQYNSITISSPGILLKGKDINKGHYIKRNMWIYEKMLALDTKERFAKQGRGFNRMQKAFKNKGRVTFVNSHLEDCFKVIFPGTIKFK